MSTKHRRYSARQIVSERSFLRCCLSVKINDDHLRLHFAQNPVDTVKRIFKVLHENHAHKIYDTHGISPVVKNRISFTDNIIRKICRADNKIRRFVKSVHLFSAETMIAGSNNIGSAFEKVFCGNGSNAVTVSRIFAIHNNGINIILFFEQR